VIALRDRSDGDRGDRRNRVGLGDRKDREQAIADEFEDFPAMRADFGVLGLEQGVEERDHPLAGQPVRTLGKAAQVGGPQHRGQRHSGAAADLSGQHLRPGIGAEISAKQIVRDPILIVPVGGDREAPPQCFPAIADAPHRVLLIGDRVADLVRDHHLHDLSRISPPGNRGAEELRMQRGGVERYAQERHSSGDQAPGKFVEAGNALGELAPLEQPVGDIVDRVVNRTPFGRTRQGSNEGSCRFA